MIYFIYGTDNFRVANRIKEIRLGNFNADYQTVDAKGLSFVEFNNMVSTQSLLSPEKIVVIRDLLKDGSDDLKQKILFWLEEASKKEIILIFREDGEPDRRTKLFKILNKQITELYNTLKPVQARDWLKQQSQAYNLNLAPDATDILLRDFSSDLWRLSKEIEKLSIYSQDQKVDKKIVNKLVPQALNDNIFATIDALAKKDMKLANKLINIQLSLGMNEQQLLTMIAYQFRNMVLIRSLVEQGTAETKLTSITQLHPYVVQKNLSFIKNFSLKQLNKIFLILHKVDSAIKNGKTPSSVGLDILTAQIVNS